MRFLFIIVRGSCATAASGETSKERADGETWTDLHTASSYFPLLYTSLN